MALHSPLYRLPLCLAVAAEAVAQTGQYGASLSSKSVDLFAAPHPSPLALPRGVARFDTWVVRLPTADLSESVYGDYRIVEREQRRIVLERFVRDYFRHIYVGYMVTLEWIPELNSLQVAFSAATGPPAADLPAREIWKITSPARCPVPQMVKWGDEISVHLAQVEKGVELIDYIQFSLKDKIEPRKSAPRDFYDESAEFQLKMPRLRVNGAPQNLAPLPDTVQGTAFWIYAPGRGRYVLTFSPHPELGLDRVGEVTGDHMTVNLDGNLYRVDCGDRIAPGSGVYNVYGFRDSNWEPPDPKDHTRVVMGPLPTLTAIQHDQ